MKYLYKNELITLYSIFEFGNNLFIKLIVPDDADWNVKKSMLIFKQAIDSVGIILSSLPDSPLNSEFKSFNPSILGSQGRILIDHYITIAYLMGPKEPAMLNFQKMVWDQAIDFKRFFLVENYNPRSTELPQLKEQIKNNEKLIRENPLYEKLPKEIRNNCANGFSDKIYQRNQIKGIVNIVPKIFWTIDTHFSQYIHSTAFSTDQLALIGKDINKSFGFVKNLVAKITGLFSLILLEIIYSSDFSREQIPLGVFQTILFWKDFFEGKADEE